MQTNTAAEYGPTPVGSEAFELETALYSLAVRVIINEMAINNTPEGWSPELDRAVDLLKRRGSIDLRAVADKLFDT